MAEIVGQGIYELRTDDSRFTKGLQQAEKQAGSFGDRLGKIGKVGTVAFAAAGAGAAAFATQAARSFVDFERGMNEVFTLLPGAGQQVFDELTAQVKSFSKEFGVLPQETVPALYQALSAGVPRDNVFSFLETSQKASVGGITDLATAVDGISSVVNAYGADVISATNASDLMFTAVKLGKTDFEQLSSSIFNVTPIAAALGVQFSDVTAALAALTAQGVPTSVATTQIRAALAELGKEGTAVSSVFEDVAGKSFQQFISEGGNLQGALQLLEGHANESGQSMVDLFGSIEAGQAALALTGKGADAFTSAIEAMAGSAGATEDAYSQMESGLDQALKRLRAQFELLKIEVGSRVAPVLADLVDFALERGVPALQSLADRLSGPVRSGFVFVRDAILTFIQAIQGDWTNAEGIRPFHSIIGQIGMVVRDVVLPGIEALSDLFRGDFSGALDAAGDSLGGMIGGLAGLGGKLLGNLVNQAKKVKWTELASTVGSGLAGALGRLGGLGVELLGSLSQSLANADWGGMAGTVVDGLLGGMGKAAGFGARFAGWVAGQATSVDWSGVASAVAGGVITGLGMVGDFGGRFLSWISGQLQAVDWTGVAQTVINGIVSGATAVGDAGARLVGWMADTFRNTDWAATGQSFIDGLTAGLGAAAGGATWLSDWLGNAIASSDFAPAAAAFQTGFSNAFNAVSAGGGSQILDKLLGGLDQLGTFVTEKVGPGIAQLADLIGPRIMPTIQTFSDSIGRISSQLGEGLGPVLDSLRQSWANLQPAIAPAAEMLGMVAGLVAGVLFVALNTLFEVVGSMLPGAFQALTGALQVVGGLMEVVSALISGAIQIVVGLLTGDWQMAWDGARTIVSGTVGGIISIVEGLWTAVSGIVRGLVDGVIGFFEGLYNSLVGNSIVPDIINGIIGWFGRLPGEVIGIIGGFVASVLGFFSDLLTTVPGLVGDLVGSVQGFLVDMAAEAPGIIGGMVTAMLGKLGDLALEAPGKITEMQTALAGRIGELIVEAFNWGANIVRGLINGLGSLLGDLRSKAQEIVDTIKNPIEGAKGFLFGSPSRVALQWGLDILEGLKIGIEQNTPEVLDAVDRLIGSMRGAFDLLIAAGDASAAASQFSAPGAGVVAGIVAFAQDVTAQIQAAAVSFEQEGLDATGRFAGAAGAVMDLIGAAVEALTGLGGYETEFGVAAERISQIKFLVVHAVQSMGDAAALMDLDYLEGARIFSEAAIAVVDLLGAGIDKLAGLADFTVDLDRAKLAVSDLKFVIEHAVQSIGDTAALVASTRPEGFVGAAGLFATSAEAVMTLMGAGLEFIGGLLELGQGFDLAAAMAFGTNLKFLIEHLVLSIGDSAAYLASIRPEDFLEPIEGFSAAAESVMNLMGAAGSFIQAALQLSEDPDAGSADYMGLADRLVKIIQYVVRRLGVVAKEFSTEGLEHIETFSTSADAAFRMMGSAADAFERIAEQSELTPEHMDVFLANYRIAVDTVKAIADLLENEGIDNAQDALAAAEEIAKLLEAANEAINSIAPPSSSSGGPGGGSGGGSGGGTGTGGGGVPVATEGSSFPAEMAIHFVGADDVGRMLVATPANVAGIDPSSWLARAYEKFGPGDVKPYIGPGLEKWGAGEVREVQAVIEEFHVSSPFVGMPSLDGGGVMLRDYPIYAHAGEIVASPSQIGDALDGVGGGDTYEINIDGGGGDPEELVAAFRFAMATMRVPPGLGG